MEFYLFVPFSVVIGTITELKMGIENVGIGSP
jgi:hypothetical protein